MKINLAKYNQVNALVKISFAIDCSLIKYIVTNCDISTFKV